MNDWLKALQDHRAGKADAVPPGWKTLKQIAEEIAKHYKNNEFDALLKELCVEGIVKKYKENIT